MSSTSKEPVLLLGECTASTSDTMEINVHLAAEDEKIPAIIEAN
jgi:hypothetical protein